MIDAAACARKTSGYGHLGYPALASEPVGRELNELTAEDIAIVVRHFVEKDGWEPYEHHALWKVPVLRMLA